MCEILGCPPSQIRVKYPDMTLADYVFLSGYSIRKMEMEAQVYGWREARGTMHAPRSSQKNKKGTWAEKR